MSIKLPLNNWMGKKSMAKLRMAREDSEKHIYSRTDNGIIDHTTGIFYLDQCGVTLGDGSIMEIPNNDTKKRKLEDQVPPRTNKRRRTFINLVTQPSTPPTIDLTMEEKNIDECTTEDLSTPPPSPSYGVKKEEVEKDFFSKEWEDSEDPIESTSETEVYEPKLIKKDPMEDEISSFTESKDY